MFQSTRYNKRPLLRFFGIAGMVILLSMLVVACGGASTAGTNSAPTNSQGQTSNSSNGPTLAPTPGGTGQQQYLIKSFTINMQVKDTQKVAFDLQSWITTTDPLALVSSVNSQQVVPNQYSISMTFSVQASLFPRIESYLNSYPTLHNGMLLNVAMNTQDVSGDYIDSQSRLKNLQTEQQRLLTLMSKASALADVLSLDQQLTNVEGQIEQLEAHLLDIKGQTSFYTVAINLQPAEVAVTPPPAPGWNPGDVWQGAVSAVKVVGQVLATAFIWLLVFCVYIVPLGIVGWLARRWWHSRMLKAIPRATPNATP